MSNNNILFVLGATVVIVLVGLLVYWFQKRSRAPLDRNSAKSPQTPTPPQTSDAKGIHYPAPKAERELDLSTKEMPTYKRRDHFFSPAERYFFEALLEALTHIEGSYQVFSKVRLGDIIFIANEPENKRAFNSQLWYRHIDFVICERPRLKILLAVELDDSSHNRYDTHEGDLFKTDLFSYVKTPLLRFKAQSSYKQEDLIFHLGEAIRIAKANSLSNIPSAAATDQNRMGRSEVR